MSRGRGKGGQQDQHQHCQEGQDGAKWPHGLSSQQLLPPVENALSVPTDRARVGKHERSRVEGRAGG
ncbi:hypothetical protein ACFFX0_31780 [Citricoccus parietis]|uniref:Uncharacterized protein n=1 Tax=Citricoccus parietis TaxID=592307 RepID=A0ABV5G985_9MICC